MPARRLSGVLVVVLCAVLGVPCRADRQPPELHFEAPVRLTSQAEQLSDLDRAPLLATMDLLGLENPGPPIRVVLAPEDTPAARRAPSWAVAYAVSGAGLVVLIPSRVPAYPDRSLETVLHHEIAHVLISRAAGHHGVPRWFNEGLAVHAAREWQLEDRARVSLATFRRGGITLAELDRRFQAGAHSAAGAYALSAAFVRYVVDRHGALVTARIFDHLADGRTFGDAYHHATGASLSADESRFWRHLDLWSKWVPLLGSSTTLWMLITTLALWAFKRRRERDAQQLEVWDLEERQQLERASTSDWVH